MDKKIYGIDFGTTNSVVAVLEDGEVRVLPIIGNNQNVMRSLIFFPDERGRYFVGEDAIVEYVESGMDGRIMQSIKSFLSDRSFTGTVMGRKYYTIEDVVAIIFRELKKRADSLVGQDVRSAIFGRPAKFSENPESDSFAQQRLLKAARQAGFDEIHFQLEPVAAAFSYESRLHNPETVLVADLGGGTSDFAVVKLDPQKKNAYDRSMDILGYRGICIGGDDLDSQIMSQRLLRYFGSELHYESFEKMLPMPVHLMRMLHEWHRVFLLKTPKYREFIGTLRRLADDKEAAERLYALVEEDLSFSLFGAIERAKLGLSFQEEDVVSFNKSIIRIHEVLARGEFERMIAGAVASMKECVDLLIADAGIAVSDITSVFLTGGISQIPVIQKLFSDNFGQQKIKSSDVFVSVAEGLALSARAFF